MKTAIIPTEIALKKEQELNPLLVSRTALDIFPVAVSSDMPLALLIGTTCRNLLFYELQLLSIRHRADDRSEISTSFGLYALKLAAYLRNTDILPLLLRRVSSLRNTEELGRIQKALNELPEAPPEAPAGILLIQEMLAELRILLRKPSGDVAQKYQQLTVRWTRNQTMAPMQSIHAGSVLNLALYQVQRNLSRHRNGEERRLNWGKEIHGYYQSHLSSGRCVQTAKRLAREDFIKAHPIPAGAEDQMCLSSQPGLHRNSVLLYLKSYQDSQKVKEGTKSRGKRNEQERIECQTDQKRP